MSIAEGYDLGREDNNNHLIERLLLVLPSLVEVGAVSDVKCHAKDLDPLEPAQTRTVSSRVHAFAIMLTELHTKSCCSFCNML